MANPYPLLFNCVGCIFEACLQTVADCYVSGLLDFCLGRVHTPQQEHIDLNHLEVVQEDGQDEEKVLESKTCNG